MHRENDLYRPRERGAKEFRRILEGDSKIEWLEEPFAPPAERQDALDQLLTPFGGFEQLGEVSLS